MSFSPERTAIRPPAVALPAIEGRPLTLTRLFASLDEFGVLAFTPPLQEASKMHRREHENDAQCHEGQGGDNIFVVDQAFLLVSSIFADVLREGTRRGLD
ncbi:hypothetical protein [Rhodomicrobium lacus]|uniref:hypothetical protein n=1 Tax=Rhodomicrobium lacus TaxID=2498452 RepID=UPI0013DF1137|nr:hypothetical protein [Rhodomicrobium lacus]